MTKGNRNMPESKDCILRHQLSVLCLVLLSVQPVGHGEDERLDNILLVSPHPRPQSLAKVLNRGVSQFLEGDQSCVRLLCFLHSRRHILVAVRHWRKYVIVLKMVCERTYLYEKLPKTQRTRELGALATISIQTTLLQKAVATLHC